MGVIFYGASGEGMGHATRTEVVIKHLMKNHKIVIFSYDRAFKYLKKELDNKRNILEVVEISGINYVYEKNEFKLGKTALKQTSKIKQFLLDNNKIITDKMVEYSPNLIISDFEPLCATTASLLKIPLITIDNISFFSKCKIDDRFEKNIQVKLVRYVRAFVGDYNFIITLYNAPIKKRFKNNSYLIHPIIRDSIVKAKPVKKDHVLVYQTSVSNDRLLDVLKSTKEQYVVYGFNKSKIDKNLTFKKPSKKEFSKDLASCKAVITNGGFTLMSEALYLKKPVYSIPVRKQIEQEINGFYLEKMGYGIQSKEVNFQNLIYFLNNLKKYEQNLKKLKLDVNNYDMLDKKIDYLIEKYEIPKRAQMLAQIVNKRDDIVNKFLEQKKKLKKFTKKITGQIVKKS